MEVPDRVEDVKLALFVFRTPNGAGEYSIMEFDFTTWPEDIPLDLNQVGTVDLATAPKACTEMLNISNLPGLRTSIAYGGVYTRIKATELVMAQRKNPGFGPLCDALLVYSHITRGGIPRMPTTLGECVDATQQGADPETFKHIDETLDSVKGQIQVLVNGGATFDPAVMRRRMRSGVNWRYGKGATEKGRLRFVEVEYARAIDRIKDISLRHINNVWRDVDLAVWASEASEFRSEAHERLGKEFGKWHGVSQVGNLVVLVGSLAHLVVLARGPRRTA
jgi:hypothetical protein